MAAVIEIQDLTKVYQMGDVEVTALNGVSLTIEAGEMIAIMGPSGSGKSTLMNVIGCLDVPTDGSYILDGVDISNLGDSDLAYVRNQKIGFVFQQYMLLQRTSAVRNVELPMIYSGQGLDEKHARKVLEIVGMGERMYHLPNELSGGQQQRVAIARALVNNPRIILADEPTGALDQRTGHEIIGIFQKLNREHGITVILVTHDPEVAQHTQRIVSLRDGLIVSDEIVPEPVEIAQQGAEAAYVAGEEGQVNTAICCEGLVKQYKDKLALDGLNLAVPAGSIFGFLGPNGAGKSTTIRLLTGLTEPTAGRMQVAGIDVARRDIGFYNYVGYLDQQPQLYGWMRGREFLEFVGKLFDLHGKELHERIDEVLTLTGMTEAANRRISGYSGGMRQRLGLAQALINQPRVLFLDEPVSALDPAGRRDVLEIIDQLRGKTTVFMSTHILADVERVCDRVAIINNGRLVVESSVRELQEKYAQPVFILEPEDNQEAIVQSLIAVLRDKLWVSSLDLDGDQIRIVAHDIAIANRELLPLVAAKNLELVRFERSRPNLEEIFMRLIGSKDPVIA